MLEMLLYRSKSLVEMRSISAAEIYLEARAANRETGITGYLHQESGYFVQYVEGLRSNLMLLKLKLLLDKRHKDLKFLINEPIEKRIFPDWEMSFSDAEVRSYSLWANQRGLCTDIKKSPREVLIRFMATWSDDLHKFSKVA